MTSMNISRNNETKFFFLNKLYDLKERREEKTCNVDTLKKLKVNVKCAVSQIR